ncbi:prepilin-type N-terminal cleavage/methylation domain-containing protein [Cellulomonas sp. URHE0023]|uniref:type IV pilus modification PilV family protein n=1 Tax=Cellulomonas sp. URHE0023 TaxID=1380354 RepID=UPI000486BD98|nr:type II secretion system protein [Cellulomonas sp. URHE0023]
MQRAIERGSESGLSLIEVVVALTLLGVVAAAALTFFVRGMQSTSHLQRNQAAVTVASQAMEKVHAVYPRDTGAGTPVNGLILGRSKAAVDASFAAANPADVAQMTAAYDANAATRPGVALDISYTTKVSNATYKVTTLIGTCYRPKTASASDQNCTKAPSGSTVQLYRVTVVVTWLPGKATECKGTSCQYKVSTLIDPTVDANWNLTAKPVAYDDPSSTFTGSAGAVSDILHNDVKGFIAAGVNPTTITQPPTIGTAAVVTTPVDEIGKIKYTPPTNASGIATLKYRIKDGAGRTSNEATMTIEVHPLASAQTVGMETNAQKDFALPAVGTGLNATVTGVTGIGGTATASGTTLTVKSTSTTGNIIVKYMVKDSSGLDSAEGTITVQVTVPAKPVADNREFTFNSSSVATTYNIDIFQALGLSEPKSAYVVALSGTVPASTLGTPSVNGAKTDFTWTITSSQLNQVGVYTFSYTIKKGLSATSDVKTITVRLKPVSAPIDIKAVNAVSSGASKTLTLTGVPTTFTNMTYAATVPVCTIGGGATVTAPNVATATGGPGLTFKAPTWNTGDKTGSCTFTYTMTWTGGTPSVSLSSDPATVTIAVSRP